LPSGGVGVERFSRGDAATAVEGMLRAPDDVAV
jgi:hypothetical protein